MSSITPILNQTHFTVSVFRHKVAENSTLPGYYTASSCYFFQ